VRVVELRDRDRIAGWCGRRPGVHAYALGDLDDRFWPHTRWFGLETDDGLAQVAFLYHEHDPPTFQAIPEEPVASMTSLLEGLRGRLPERFECHADERSLPTLLLDHVAVRGPFSHVKMQLGAQAALDALARDDVAVLTGDDLAEVERLYASAYPSSWFHARRLETGRYVGLRENGALVCLAGVHVHAPDYGVAALGDVATLPSSRGRGHATATCASLCRLLLADGCSTIALNVRQDNLAAIRAYERIGFAIVAQYLEVTLQRRAS
jgi:ribosomal protein S18 acetylase RimI-like enzyme